MKMTRVLCKGVALVAVATCGLAWMGASARADSVTLDFTKITNNNVEDLAGQVVATFYNSAQDPYGLTSGNEVLLVVTNTVGTASNVSDIYIDDDMGILTGPPEVHNTLGGFTLFVPGAGPVLPGGNNAVPPFVATTSLSASAPGAANRGLDQAGDVLGLVYDSSGWADVKAALLSTVEDSQLRVGLHVRSIGSEGRSDSYLGDPRNPSPPIPLPAAAWMGMSALAGIGAVKKIRSRWLA